MRGVRGGRSTTKKMPEQRAGMATELQWRAQGDYNRGFVTSLLEPLV
jgi:hypothetical protein